MKNTFGPITSAIEGLKMSAAAKTAGTPLEFDYAEPYMLTMLRDQEFSLDDHWEDEARAMLTGKLEIIGQPDVLVRRVAMQMRLEGMRSRFTQVFEKSRWHRKECPFCGSMAGLGRIGKDGKRSLFCSFCWTEWDYLRQTCPFCESAAGEYALFEVDGVDVRLDYCAACRNYIKTLVHEIGIGNPASWDLNTLIADNWAVRNGYTRPAPHLTGIDFFKIQ